MPEKFPLWRHPGGQWCKKHAGRCYYFGLNRDAALRRYVAEWPEIVSGRGRPTQAQTGMDGEVTVAYLCNAFLAHKRTRVQSGEMSEASWAHCRRMTLRVLAALGRHRHIADLGPADFGRIRAEAQRTLGPRTLRHFLGLARGLFRFGSGLTDKLPRYGDQFDPPPVRVLRLQRETRGERLLSADQLRRILKAADPVARAAILLGLNCAFGATDLSELRQAHLEARPGWVALPRRKTGIGRRCPLWPETTAAIEAAWKARPRPANPADADRLFLSPTGLPAARWVQEGAKVGSNKDAVNPVWLRACRAAGVQVPRGSGYYLLRHVFRTVADELPDRPAVDLIMGHADVSMAAHYVERVEEKRLAAVTNHVRAWLWPGRQKMRRETV